MNNVVSNQAAFAPQLNEFIFWDVDASKLNYTTNAEWIIRRVFDKGTMDDIYAVVSHYGKDKAGKTLMQTATLREPIMYLAALMFHLNPADFVCYK